MFIVKVRISKYLCSVPFTVDLIQLLIAFHRSPIGFMSLLSGGSFVNSFGYTVEDWRSFKPVGADSSEMAGQQSVDNQTDQSSQFHVTQVLSSDEEKRARKKRNDCNYRLRKKARFEKLEEDNNHLQGEVEKLRLEKDEVFKKYQEQKGEVQKVRLEKDELSKQCQEQKKASEKLSMEKEELSKQIRQLQSNAMLPSGHLQRRQVYNHRNFEMEGNEVSFMSSIIPYECYSDTFVAEFMAKLDDNVKSNIDTLHFTELDGERRKIGTYNFPLSLVPTAMMITKAYGDITEESLLNHHLVEDAYILFCTSIKEMNELPLERVTEVTMLKWRDTIKDAMRINLNVSFAMEHLKKIAQAYFGLKAFYEQWNLDKQITRLENQLYVLWQENGKIMQELDALKEKKAQKEALKSEQREACIAAAEDFKGKTVGSGLLGF